MKHTHDDGKFTPWVPINTAFGALIDGGDPNDNSKVLLVHPRGEDGINPQVAYFRMVNRSGGAVTLGLGCRLSKSTWRAGQWTHGTTTYTDDTTDFQSSASNDAPLETTTNGDGYLVACRNKFNAISLKIGTASTGSPARTLEYSTAGGSWASAGTIFQMNTSSNYPAAGTETMVWFSPPVDWAPLEAGHGTNVPVGLYGVRVRATTAPTIAGIASSISVHMVYFSTPNIANNAFMEVPLGGIFYQMEPSSDAIVACVNAANAQNTVTALVRTRG